MAISISKNLKKKIADDHERLNIEQLLKEKSADKCYLCEGPFNYASETIEADHDIPEHEGGATSVENLNLTHKSCNRFKRNNSSILVKGYLPFKRFIENNDGAKFDDVLTSFFDVEPKEIHVNRIDRKNKTLDLHFGNGTHRSDIPFYEDRVPQENEPVTYTYLQIPITSIFNDSVQPRSIKLDQIWKLFQDLHQNPLHEPASVRLRDGLIEGKNALLMFDGQHKTVSKLLLNSGSDIESAVVDVKIYLNLNKELATVLVNSIQSKITKLGLTKVEFAKKMGQEFQHLFEEYDKYCREQDESGTEDGFLKWVPTEKRKRAKEALFEGYTIGLIEEQSGEQPLEIKEVLKSGKIKETTFFNKILRTLLVRKPLTVDLELSNVMRERERNNIRLLLELYFQHCLNESRIPEAQIRVFRSQSVIVHLFACITQYIPFIFKDQLLGKNSQESLLIVDLKTQSSMLEQAIKRYTNHPIWKSLESGTSTKVVDFRNLLQKNSSLTALADEIKLNLPYMAALAELQGDEIS